MAAVLSFFSYAFIFTGVVFIIIGTIGLFRFIDVYTRLHVLAKIDNLGLGCIVAGLVLQSSDLFTAAKLILIWVLALLSSATIAFIISNHADKNGEAPILHCDLKD